MYYALSMAGVGSDTETRSEFNALLGWENQSENEVLTSMKGLYTELMPPTNKVKLTIANSLWQKMGAPIKVEYKNLVAEYFDAEVRELDFANPESVNIINSWIEVKTNNLIQDMLDAISPDAIMYLINAIYFKGDWKYVFDTEDNFQAPFYKADGNNEMVTYMHQKTYLNHLQNDNFALVQLPYSDSNYCMTLLLPNENTTTNDLLTQLNSQNWKSWSTALQMDEVEISLPKFKYKFGTRNINSELQTMGLLKAFNANEADFSKISDIQIYISRVLHQAFIEVNEQGSEAAAATILEFENTSIGNDVKLVFNKPFIYAIEHKPTQSILFIGKVAFPEQ